RARTARCLHSFPTRRSSDLADSATKGAKSPNEIARAAYDFTVSTMKYDKPKDKPGWGKGSTQWACDSKFGNCTDFHAMIMSIGRDRKSTRLNSSHVAISYAV